MEGFGFLIGLGYLAAFGTFIGYVWNLQILLRRCSADNRTLRPGLVWLQVIPVFGAVWQFWVVRRLSSSLESEYRSRGWQVPSAPGCRLGLAKAIVDAVALLHVIAAYGVAINWDTLAPTIGLQVSSTYLIFMAGLLQVACVVLWGAYWATLSKYSTALRLFPDGMLPIAQPMPARGYHCWNCGHWVGGDGRFCSSCGAQQGRAGSLPLA